MALIAIVCAQCGLIAQKEAGGVNRSVRIGAPVFCSRGCAGLARRDNRTEAERKAIKAAYDAEYRMREPERRRAERAAYYQRTRDPVREAEIRKRRMPQHVEYCRRPEYRKWKAQYDRRYLARKQFGSFGEAAIVLNELCSEIASRSTFNERAADKGTLNKHLQRRRDYEQQTQRR